MENILNMECSKTLAECLPQMMEKTSESSSKISHPYANQKYGYLDLRGENGLNAEKSWVIAGLLPGVSSMHGITVSLRGVKESTLSQILQDNVPETYNLSAKACQGILNRASARGKVLPLLLETALREQIVRLS